MSSAAPVEQWAGEDVSISLVEHELAALRESSGQNRSAGLRTSVMTHVAWVPEDWLDAAHDVLAGLAERHPSRTIVLVPDPAADRDAIDACLSLRDFPLEAGSPRHVCAEVVELRLRGARAQAPGSIVEPLLISDLPAFCRWRGQPPFGAPELDQLVGVVDRLIVDSSEWEDVPGAYGLLAGLFDHVSVSDIAWARTAAWRACLAGLWPSIAEREIGIRGPRAEGAMLTGWLTARLECAVGPPQLAEVLAIDLDGELVSPPQEPALTAAELLSNELERYGRDRIYEQAIRAAVG